MSEEKFLVHSDAVYHVRAESKEEAEKAVNEMFVNVFGNIDENRHGKIDNIMSNMVVAEKGDYKDE